MFLRSVADASSSSCGLERARRPPAPSRNRAGEAAMADEDGLLPVGLAPEGENDDDTRADAAALFGIDLGDGSAAPIDVDADGGEGAMAIANSNGSAPSVAGTGNTSKRKSPVWADF